MILGGQVAHEIAITVRRITSPNLPLVRMAYMNKNGHSTGLQINHLEHLVNANYPCPNIR